MKTITYVATLFLTGWIFAPGWAGAGTGACPSGQPNFAYLDTNNDGCFSEGTDSDSINSLLLAGSYVGPDATGIVVPDRVVLRPGAGVAIDWNSSAALIVDGTVQTEGADLYLTGASSVQVSGKIEARAQADSVSISCGPACLGGITLARGSAIKAGAGVNLVSASSLNAGEKVTLSADSGDLTVSATTELSFGDLTRIDAGLSVDLEANDVTIGDRSKISSEDSIRAVGGHAISLGARSKITARNGTIDLGAPGDTQQILTGSRLRLTAGTTLQLQASNSILVAEGGSLRAGKGGPSSTVKVLAGSLADFSGGARLRAEDFIQVTGATINFASRSKIEVKGESASLDLLASSSISIVDSRLQARVGSMSVQSGGAIALTNSSYRASGVSPALTFSATDPGTCDLSASRFKNVTPNTTACGSVLSR